jgi:hypothetical protein
MGVESAIFSYPYGSVSAAVRFLAPALTLPGKCDAQQRAQGGVVVAAFCCEGRHGPCLLVCWEDAAQGEGLVSEESAV